MARPFLTAAWRDLVVCNFEIDPAVVEPLVPSGTELDLFEGKAYVSIVAFQFLNTRVLGLPIPFHRDFDEINLRFYTKYRAPEGWRRGVTFIKELVPRTAIALVARWLYNENYYSVPMGSRHQTIAKSREHTYDWEEAGQTHTVTAVCQGASKPIVEGSFAEFITEHYWGYTRQRNGATMEYQVAHPRWGIWEDAAISINCDFSAVYGDQFAKFLNQKPAASFVADGSPIAVYKGTILSKSSEQ